MHPRSRHVLDASLLALILHTPVAAQAPGIQPISGRRIAPVMGWQGVDWLERPERLEEEDPDTAIAALKIQKGDAVADIGAGSGYMTMKLAQRVGPAGHVF